MQAFNGGCPKPAAVAPYPEQRSANFAAHLFLPRLRWNYIEHVGCGRPPSPAEVIAVVANLHPQSGPLERAAVPFQEEDHLPFRQQVAAPSVGNRTQFVGLGVGVPRAAFADPVVQALIGSRRPRHPQIDEEAVGFQVVDRMEAVTARVVGSMDLWCGAFAEALGDDVRASPRRQQDRVPVDPSRGVHARQSVHEAGVSEPLDAVLAATLVAGEHEAFDLEPIQVAVLM